jgi:hypothetical protein
MLIARSVTRAELSWFRPDQIFDLVRDGDVVGRLVCRTGAEAADITLGGASFRAARAHPRREDTPLARAVRIAKGLPAAGPNPVRLIDASGLVRAKAEEGPDGVGIEVEGQTFKMRRRSAYALRFDLYAGASPGPIGSVGQMDALSASLVSECTPEIDDLAQAFLLALVADAAAAK